MNNYTKKVYLNLKKKYAHEKEFLQAAEEILESLSSYVEKHPEIEKNGILERFVEPERIIQFRVSWVNDKGKVQVNTGYRVQFSSAIGPYKGGLRFAPNVNLSIIKFLGLEQVLKNSLTTLPMGGGKGGSDFDPKGKSDGEVMRFCQAFMTELNRHIAQFTDVLAGDIGVGSREVSYLYGQYKRIRNESVGVLTGKRLSYGGSLIRTEATGYGLCYFTDEALKKYKNTNFNGKRVIVSGSGNVALYACKKAMELGAKVVAMSDSSGYVYDESGIDIDLLIDLKENKRQRISEYAKIKNCIFNNVAKDIWKIKCDIALPCATQNELDLESAKALVNNGCFMVCEGANMPCTKEATNYLMENKVVVGPAKASNAGGVAVSGIEMSQNSMRFSYTAEEVDQKLKNIMVNIFNTIYDVADKELNNKYDLVSGANIAGFKKVADAMLTQGVI